MDIKPKRRTRERILEASLRLFNDFGEPNVTTTVIADDLNISPNTVRVHISRIYEKLETCNKTEALNRARQLGLLG